MMVYNDLLDSGWRMGQIDCMDFNGYVKVRAWKVNRNTKNRPKYIDEVWPDMKSR